MEKYVIGYTKETGLIFRSLGDNLIYSDEEMTQKINNLKAKEIIVHYNSSDSNFFYNLELTEYPWVSNNTKKIKEITIKSNNRVIMTICNTEMVKFPIWFDNLSKLVKEDYGEICKEVKAFLIKYPNIINYTDNQLDEMIKKEKLKRSDESRLKILEVKKQTIKNVACRLYDYDSNQINNEIQNICTKFNNEELNKLIQIVNYKRKEILKKEIKAIIRLLAIILFTVIMKKFLPIGMFIPGEIILIGIAYASKTLNIKQLVVYFNQRKKSKEILKLIDNTKQEITLTKNNVLNNNSQEISKEDNQIRKDSYLESLKENINLMAENPNIDWTTEKKKIMILAEGYTKYKKTSQLDNITLLQTCPTFMSELCDLEIAIKNKINANKKEDVYEEDLAEITTLLNNIKTPEMTLKLERKL